MCIEHRSRSSHRLLLAITDDERDREEVVLLPPRKGQTTLGKLRSADTSAIHQVMWPHELIFTAKVQPITYKSLSIMAFVNGFLTIMALQTDALKIKIVCTSSGNVYVKTVVRLESGNLFAFFYDVNATAFRLQMTASAINKRNIIIAYQLVNKTIVVCDLLSQKKGLL